MHYNFTKPTTSRDYTFYYKWVFVGYGTYSRKQASSRGVHLKITSTERKMNLFLEILWTTLEFKELEWMAVTNSVILCPTTYWKGIFYSCCSRCINLFRSRQRPVFHILVILYLHEVKVQQEELFVSIVDSPQTHLFLQQALCSMLWIHKNLHSQDYETRTSHPNLFVCYENRKHQGHLQNNCI